MPTHVGAHFFTIYYHFHVSLCEREAHAFKYKLRGLRRLAAAHSRPAVSGAVFFLEHVPVKHAVQTIQSSEVHSDCSSSLWYFVPSHQASFSDPRPSPRYISRFFLRCSSLEINLMTFSKTNVGIYLIIALFHAAFVFDSSCSGRQMDR